MRTVGAVLAMTAMAVAAVPADARDERPKREGKRDRDRGRDRGDRIDGGDMALGALLLGGVLAIAGAGKKKKPPVTEAVAAEPLGSAMGSAPALAIEEMTADDAADACAQAAESRGVKIARIAQVGTISSVERSGVGWLVSGTVSLRDGYRDATGRPGRFHCTLGTSEPPRVRFDGEPETLASAAF